MHSHAPADDTQSATAIRDSVFTASYLGLCPSLKEFLDRQQALQQAPPGTTLALAGISGGLFAAALTQPVDTAKTRMQAFIDNKVRHITRKQAVSCMCEFLSSLLYEFLEFLSTPSKLVSAQAEYATLQSTMSHIVKAEGLSSLFAGIAPRAVRIAGAVIILQSVRTRLISLVEGMRADDAALEEVPLVPLPSE